MLFGLRGHWEVTMRTLRVIGLDADGRSVICEDAECAQQFRLPADEHLRAAARGDLARLGQLAIEIGSQLRPKEIQARIRAGSTVEDVAAASGVPAQRVERYAHPVLLERSRAAQIAQGGHPLRPDGPAVETLLQVVHAAFGVRGQDLDSAHWDAWRGEDGRWVVQLRWNTGRSDNRAHWRFQPGAHGGTIIPLDDHAADLVDPDPTRPLRTVAAIVPVVSATPVAEDTLPDVVITDVDAPSGPPSEPAAATQPQVQRGRPTMPSWADVVLGVRSQRG